MTPKLRFPGFNENWSIDRIGDIFNISAGGDIAKLDISKEKSDKYPHPVFANALSNLGLIGYSNTYKSEADTITVTGRGDVGFAIARHKPYTPVVRLLSLSPKNNSSVYFFSCAINNLRIYNESTGVPQLTAPQLASYKVAAPSVREQEKIAEFLTAVDERIELASRKVEKLETYKRSLTQKIFTRTLRFKCDDGSDFPEWEEKRLFDTAINMRSGGTPTATNRLYYDNGNIPFLAISDMTEQGKYLEWTSKFINQAGLDNSSSWLVPAGSLVYSMYASVGFVSITKVDMAISQAVMAIILKPKFDIDFIYYSLSNFKNLVHKYVETGTQGNLNAEIVKNIPLGMPCLEEQQKIATFLSQIDEKIILETSKLEGLKKFKKALLQRMFV